MKRARMYAIALLGVAALAVMVITACSTPVDGTGGGGEGSLTTLPRPPISTWRC
ncbi:MAG: hypothetical protein LBP23_09185 [Treponema sp.]|jgi:hypothetical protein|nr:hypothetical protein [Treponema sp.]